MKRKLLLMFVLISCFAKAQVGIGTANPQATLDVRVANPASPTIDAGIAIPQVSVLPSSGNRAGQLVYLTSTNLYYCYNGSSWYGLATQVYNFGDVKYGFQGVDHNGWILLDGRLKSSLTATQQAAATALGIGANLPNLSDRGIVGASGTKTLNTTGGNASVTINQNQLPNVTLTTSTDGAHTHLSGNPTAVLLNILGQSFLASGSNTNSTTSAGAHSHTTSSINGGVTQQNLSVQDPYLALNGFIYLGQ
ncbi:hypothetical protein [Flavobacterium humi]|uniref:Phage tail collar domain-containing protein n=1 Tax=Flavobacterium humi TaxID=2562683 RepID=A0A4Z0L9C5_9FLAO|nr:hypothetical protein [Flavobacterium humi]TGD59065.1 hypothetical protein E4635_04220 [Flavobacterium humi]